jgi:hypothetical protein
MLVNQMKIYFLHAPPYNVYLLLVGTKSKTMYIPCSAVKKLSLLAFSLPRGEGEWVTNDWYIMCFCKR